MNKNWKTNTALFLGSQTISLFGSSLVQYAISWYITLRTGSGVMMTIMIICGFLPTFFVSPFAGVWADRYNRKTLIVLADAMIAAFTLVLAVLFLMGRDYVWLLFAVSSIRAIGAGIQAPAVNAFIPQLVPEDKLMTVNAANGSIQSIITLLSPALSGVLLSVTDLEVIFFIDVITAAIAISALLLFLRVDVVRRAEKGESGKYFHEMRQGIEYIIRNTYIKKLFLFSAVFFFSAAPAAFLTPLQVTRNFGGDVWRLTAIEMAFSIGMTIGGITMMRWKGFQNRIHSIVLGAVVFGAGTVMLGVMPVFWLYLPAMGIVGISMPVFNTSYMSLLQQKVDGAYMGRVFGVLFMISSTMMPLGMLIFGPIADSIRIEILLIGTGLVLIAVGLIMFRDKALIKAGIISSEKTA